MEYTHDVDDELINYLTNRFHRWEYTQQQINGVERIRINLLNTPPDERFIPVYFKFGNIHEKQQIVEEIFSEGTNNHLPAIVVEPRPIEPMDRERAYTNYDTEFDATENTVTLRKGKRRLKFVYQVEGVAKRWTDYQLMKSLLEFRLFERSGIENYVPLFGKTYTVQYDPPQLVSEEDKNLFRCITVVNIEMDLFTLPEEVYEPIEKVLVDWENEIDTLQ